MPQLPAGFSKVRLANVDAILDVSNQIIGFFNPDGTVSKVPRVETNTTTGAATLIAGESMIRLCGPRSIMWLGDSLTQYGGGGRHPFTDHNRAYYYKTTFTNINAAGGLIRYARIHPECPVGNGTLRYYVATDTFSWQAFGDTEGTQVSANTGFIVAESGTANRGIYLACLSRFKPVADTSDTINVQLSDGPSITRCNLSGFTGWAELLLGCPFDVSLNYGISGVTTSEMWGFRSTWQNVGTETTVIHLGTNQTNSIAEAQQSIADLEQIILARLAVGSKVVVCTMFPENSLTATKYGAKEWHRQENMRLCKRVGVAVADGFSRLADPLATDGRYRSADVTKDGIHVSGKGAYIFAAKELVPILAKTIQAPIPRPNGGVVYDATLAPYGNLLTNGTWGVGVAGTKGTRTTGDIGNSWNVSMNGGSVGACVGTAPLSASPVARTDGYPGNWQQFALNNAGGVANEYMQAYQAAFVSGSNYAAGDYTVGEIELRLSTTGIASLLVTQGTTNYKSNLIALDSGDSLYDLDGDTINVIARSFPVKVEAGQTNMQFSLFAYLTAGGTATLQVADTVLRKTPAI